MRTRFGNLMRLRGDRYHQAIVREYCKRNITAWVNDWVWTFDPRQKPSSRPMLLFPVQEQYLLWRQERCANKEGGVVEKSRDMGATWLNALHHLHSWLFEDGFKGAFGSRKEDLVDRIGDPDSIFEKIRIAVRLLPMWMLPEKYDLGYLKLVNSDRGSSITGEAGDNMGRGGRSRIYDVDEAAFLERPDKVDAAISANSEIIFYTSTPNGPGNPFAKKRHGGKHKVFTLHWRDHPFKDDAWYEKQKDNLSPITLAQEIDIDYNASVEGVLIPMQWVRSAVDLELPRSGPLVAGMDVASGGSNKTVLQPRQGPVADMPVEWSIANTTETAYKAKDLCVKEGITHLFVDAVGPGSDVINTYELMEDFPFEVEGIVGGSQASEFMWESENRTSRQKFINLRAELAWALRQRFERTYEYVTKNVPHMPEDLISIPNYPKLINQLGQPLYSHNATGKIKIEGKPEMKARGIESPDNFDALMYAFCEVYQNFEAKKAIELIRNMGYG